MGLCILLMPVTVRVSNKKLKTSTEIDTVDLLDLPDLLELDLLGLFVTVGISQSLWQPMACYGS